MQGLVYIFIAAAALGVGAAAYLGLTFSPIESAVVAVAFAAVAILLFERRLRRRAEARLERAIEDLGRLLATNAQAGQVLSQRVNALADTNLGSRMEGLEADISVLGTVVRQLAEAVAEMDEKRTPQPRAAASMTPVEDDLMPEPVIPISALRRALEDQRLIFHIQPIVQLPQRKAIGYEMVPRLMKEEGGLADAADFMPRGQAFDLLRRIEAIGLDEAVVIARRARTAGQPVRLVVPLSGATLGDLSSLELTIATLTANQVVNEWLVFAIAQEDWKQMSQIEKRHLADVAKTGAGFALDGVTNLRLDFAELQGLGFSMARFDASTFLRRPESFTDFHTADVAPYAKRFGLELCATGVMDEQQLLGLLEDGILLAEGPHIGRAGPARQDLVADRPALAMRAEARA